MVCRLFQRVVVIGLIITGDFAFAQRGGGIMGRGGAVRGGAVARGGAVRGSSAARGSAARGGFMRGSAAAEAAPRASYSALRSALRSAAVNPQLGRPTLLIRPHGEIYSGARSIARLDRSGVLWRNGEVIGRVQNGQLINTTGYTIGRLQGFVRSSSAVLSRSGNSVVVLRNTWFDVVRDTTSMPEMFYVRLHQPPHSEGSISAADVELAPELTAEVAEKDDFPPSPYTDEQRIDTAEYTVDLKGCQKVPKGLRCKMEITSKGLDRKIRLLESKLLDNRGYEWSCQALAVRGSQPETWTTRSVVLPAGQATYAHALCPGDPEKISAAIWYYFSIENISHLRHDAAHGDVWWRDGGYLDGMFENFTLRDSLGKQVAFQPRTVENARATTTIEHNGLVEISLINCVHAQASAIGSYSGGIMRDFLRCNMVVTNKGHSILAVSVKPGVITDQHKKQYKSIATTIAGKNSNPFHWYMNGHFYPNTPTDVAWWFDGSWPGVKTIPLFQGELDDLQFSFQNIGVD